MSDYEDDYDESDDEVRAVEPAPAPPGGMKLTVEVGLTEYTPNGLLNLLAQGILRDIGGRDKWAELLEEYLLDLGKQRAEELVTAEVERIFAAGVAGLDFTAIVRETAERYMGAAVGKHDGKEPGHYNRGDAIPRLEYLATTLVKQAMEAAWKEAEADWKARTQAAIKATLTEVMAERLAKALPAPPELR